MGCLPCLSAAPKDSALAFSNAASNAVGDHSIAGGRRVHFGVFFPEDIPCPPVHMFFDREKASTKILDGACAHAGLKMERGRLAGSPERLNLFTLEGDVLRLDLEIEAHLGSTLQPSSILVLEKGNRISDDRLDAIKAAIDEQSDGAACAIM
tara:strand:- start:208 stop:663 length:456 start_codon:yes stop_codon:yes gene_type:complete